MADSIANNNVTKSSSGAEIGDISALQNITNESPLTDISGAYEDVGHQLAEITKNAYDDVGARQTALIGNDFGQSPYNYFNYYQPGVTDAQSALRVSGTQHALEVGMDRAKKEAENAAKAAQQNYANAQSTLQALQDAQKNPTVVTAGEVGDGTSAEELINFVSSSNAESEDEAVDKAAGRYLHEALINGEWDIREYRDAAKAATLAKFGISEEQYKNFSQEEHDAFWARDDVGRYWTNKYVYEYAKGIYGEQTAKDYQEAYDYNYNIVKKVFDEIKSGSTQLQECFAYIKSIRFETKDVVPHGKITYSSNTGTITIGETKYTFDDSEEAKKGEPDSQGRVSIYSIVSEEEAARIKKMVEDIDYQERHMNYTPGIRQNNEKDLEDAIWKLEDYTANAVAKSNKAASDIIHMRKVSFETDYENVENMIEAAFGADLHSINYLMDMRANNPEQYEDLIHDYSLVLTYGQVFEVADGKKVYHTAEGDKVLEEGTYVMYTLPGFQDANGEFLEPNLKRYMELRSEEFSADMDEEELEAEMKKCLEGYQKVVTAALFSAANSDCDVNESIVHSAIYAANPSSEDGKKAAIYGGHTTAEILEKFGELADKDGEKAYTLFTKIIKKASANSGSLMANYGGKLTTIKTRDERDRDMVGSELVGSKDANTLFEEGDIDNLSVAEATALWNVIGTSIDQYNSGNQNGNIKSDFLTADGLNWFNLTGIELVKGIVGIVDLVGNLAWTTLQTTGLMFSKGLTGQPLTSEDYDNVFKSKRWGTGGITGNWTGATSMYEQFAGEYKETSFGYGESNQWRMTNNLNHLVTPILEDMWFGDGDSDKVQDAMGVGRAGDEGMNYRSAMKMTSSLAGLVGSVVAGNYIAKGVSVAAQWSSKLAKSAATAAATGIKGKFVKAAIVNGSKATQKLMDGISKVSGTIADSPVDDVARVASNYTDDVLNSTDDVTRAIVGSANYVDDETRAVTAIANNADDAARLTAGNIAETTTAIQQTENAGQAALKAFSGAYDDSVRALGAAANSITANSIDDITNQLITYSKRAAKQILGAEYNSQTMDEITKFLGTNITKQALNYAHLSAYSGLSIDDLANLGAESSTILSNLAHVQNGGWSANLPKDLANYLRKMDKDTLVSTIKEISERATLRTSIGKAWTQDDTIRFLARSGWDSKRLTLLTKNWLRDQLQDLTTDILYGYIKPEVTNEGTSRETIDEYLTNPWNYLFNLGASGLQFIGGRVANKIGQSVTAKELDSARKALQIAEKNGDSVAITRKTKRVMKLADRANRLADIALERGKSLEEVRELTGQANAYADEAMMVMNEKVFRNMSDADLGKLATDLPGLSQALTDEDLGMTRNLFYAYTIGTSKAHANYFNFKRMLNTYNGGLGNVVDVQTNGSIWKSLFEGRHDILREIDIPRESVTIAQQKQIYKAMVDRAMENPIAKTIPGLRTSLNNYFDVLLKQGEDILASGKTLRAGYLPIESMLNTNTDVAAGIRGFSDGAFVLDSDTANPYLERSIALKDTSIVDAILKGEKEIKLIDDEGNFVVDVDGNVVTRELNPEGLNFLDSITNASNAKTFHDYVTPITGVNGKQAGPQALKNAYIVVNQKGAMGAALKKSMAYDNVVMKNIENDVFATKTQKAANTKAKNAAAVKTERAMKANPVLEKLITGSEALNISAKDRINYLTELSTKLTQRQQEFPATIMSYINDAGHIDTAAGDMIFNRYKEIVKQDIAKYRNGEISVGQAISTPMYRFDRFAWQYGRDSFFGQQVKGYNHSVDVDATYYGLLDTNKAVQEPPKDMVMRRMLMTQATEPVDSSGKVWESINAKTKQKYPWQSPLRFYRSSGITDSALSNIAVIDYRSRNLEGWHYKPTAKSKPWDAAKFDSLMLDSPANIRTAKDIVAQNLAGVALPANKDGRLNKTAKNMLDVATAQIVTAAKGSSKSGRINLSFSEYVDQLSTLLAEQSVFAGAFDPDSGYYKIFDSINSYENTGGTFDEFNEYLTKRFKDARTNGEDISGLVKAWSVWNEIEAHNSRAIGLGDEFDAGAQNSEGYNVLMNSSKEAIDQNMSNITVNPEASARRNEIIAKGVEAAQATDEEITKYGINDYVGRYGKEFQSAINLMNNISDTPDNFKEGLSALKKEFDLYLAGDQYIARYDARKELLADLGGGEGATGVNRKGMLNETRDIINAAASRNKTIKKRIKDYAKTRVHRQKAYGVDYADADSKNDALKAFGATDMKSGYTEVDSPVAYRAARRNVDLYDANIKELDALKADFDDAVKEYKQALAQQYAVERAIPTAKSEAELETLTKALNNKKEIALKAQGLVDETRKVFSQAMDDKGIDLTGAFEHSADWSGSALEFDRMMLMGGSVEGKVRQAIDALNKVKSILISSNADDIGDLITRINTQIVEYNSMLGRIPEFETIGFKKAKGQTAGDSLEMSLAFTMGDTIYGEGLEQSSRYRILPDGTREIVETKPTNKMFSDEQLSSIGNNARARGVSNRRLDLDKKGNIINKDAEVLNQYGKTTFEFNGDKDAYINFENIGVDEDGPIGMSVVANNDYVDIASLSPEKVMEINTKNFDAKNSAYRLAILEDSGTEVSKPVYQFDYGEKQPEWDKLNAAKNKAEAVFAYLDESDAAKKQKIMKNNNLTKKDVSISKEDAFTDSWIAQKELDNFEADPKNRDIAFKNAYPDEATRKEAKEMSRRLALDEKDPQHITKEQFSAWIEAHRAKKSINAQDYDAKMSQLKSREAKALEDMKTAREFGDLSENEEYHAARRELSQVRSEIKELDLQRKGKTEISEPKELSAEEKAIAVGIDDVETVGETYGPYTFVKMKGEGFEDEFAEAAADNFDPEAQWEPSLEYNRDAAYTEWLAYSKDEPDISAKLEREIKKAEKVSKKSEQSGNKAKKTKINDPDDATKKTTIDNLSEEAFEGKLKEMATQEQYNTWKRAKDHLEYSRSIKDNKNAKFYRDHNGALYLADNSPLIEGYSSYANQLKARGWKPLKSGEEAPAVDAKADKKARKEMNKAITKNRHAGDVFESRLEDWQMPRDKKGNIIFDASSRNSTIANMEAIYKQVKDTTGLEIGREGLLMQNEYADLLTRITDESTTAGKFQKTVGVVSNFAQAIQNAQLAGGFSFVNALSIAHLRGAIFQDPKMMKQYIQIVGSMRNSHAVAMFAQDNIPILTKFVIETGDASILNEFGAAISTRPGVSDGGVLQNMTTNLLNLRKDFIQAKIDNDGSIPKAFKDIIAKDVQNTIFEDATFKNAMPVLRAKMLIANYDAAVNQLMHKFPDMDGKIMEKAAIKMAYGKTEAFFNPYRVMGKKKLSDVLDNTYTKKLRDFAASFTNSKSQATILDTLTNFFFALRYKMMLAGRVYDGAVSAIPTAVNGIRGITAKEASEEALDAIGTAFMHSGSMVGIGSLATCAVVAAATAKSLGIPTAWDDISWIDEYDGSFKIPDVLLKFQTIGQIWLPNAYSEEKGLYADPTKPMYGLDTMSSIFTLQNSFFRTWDRTINPETYYSAPQRGIIGSASSEDAINKFLNSSFPRAVGDELIGSNLLSPFKAVYEVIMDSTYFGNNIWEKRKLPNGKDNPNYDFGRNVGASVMHIIGLDQLLDGGKGYNSWVKGVGKPGYVEQDQIGTVKGSGILQHEFWTAAVEMMEGKYIEAIYEAGELPIKVQNLSSKARTEFNTRVKNIVAGYNDEYKAVTEDPASTNDMKDAAFKQYAKRAADAVATWSAKHNFALGKDQKLVAYVTRTLMAMVSGEYDDDMYYVQDAYWKASDIAQIEGVTADNYWLDDEDLKRWIADGKTAEEFAAEKNKRTQAYNKAQDDEYYARQALIEAGYPEEYLTKYSYSDLKAKQRAVNREIYTSIHAKLDQKVGEFDNYKEMKTYYEKLIDGATTKRQKVNLAMRYNTYVFDLLAPYAEKYGANIINDGYYNGTGLANDIADYVILPADQKYYGKTPVANYIKDVFNVGYRNGDALPSDVEIYEKFITAQNLMMKGSVSSAIAVLDNILDKVKRGQAHISDADYSRIINMRAILSARSK